MRLFLLMLLTSGGAVAGDVYRGHLNMAPETQVFISCGSKLELWVDAGLVMQKELTERYFELVKNFTEDTFVIFRGTPGPQLDCGFCEHFPGSFKVTHVLEHRAALEADCE